MAYQTVFERREIKYLLNGQEKRRILEAMALYMALDAYGRTTIRNIYLDTDNFRLIRRSLEKPVYKEKLRLRSYAPAHARDPVFVELKKKYKSVVYKRRLALPKAQAMQSFLRAAPLPVKSQIAGEIEYFRNYYGALRPGDRADAGALLYVPHAIQQKLCGHACAFACGGVRGNYDGKRQRGRGRGRGRRVQPGQIPIGSGLGKGDRRHLSGHGRGADRGHGLSGVRVFVFRGAGRGRPGIQPGGLWRAQKGRAL